MAEPESKKARTEPEGLFDGQVAIVTGGADGIGKGIAAMLAREKIHVFIFDVIEAKLDATIAEFARDGLTNVERRLVDVTDEKAVREGIEHIESSRGRLDIVVNCAGIVGPNGIKTMEVETKDFDRVMNVNCTGSFLITKYSLKAMQKRNYGRILLFASIAGKEGNAGMMAYSTSKAAVIGLAKAAGKEFAETNITINSIAPAVVRTAMVEGMKPEQVKYMTDKIPMKRCGTIEEVCSLVRFIVSPLASFNTGVCFDLTGGRATY